METEVLSESDIVRGTGSEVAVGGVQSTSDETCVSMDTVPDRLAHNILTPEVNTFPSKPTPTNEFARNV